MGPFFSLRGKSGFMHDMVILHERDLTAGFADLFFTFLCCENETELQIGKEAERRSWKMKKQPCKSEKTERHGACAGESSRSMEPVENKRESGVFRQIMLLAMVFAIGGIFGFFYEELFYRIDLGFWVKRGSTFGPWIPIYGVGAVLIVLATRRLHRQPALVFLAAAALCGGLEYGTGWVLLHVFHTRLWDYNVELWNWGNVGGFICLRSVLFFGMSALFLQYAVVPLLDRLSKRCVTVPRQLAAFLPGALFLLDILIFHLCGMSW